MNFKGRLLKTHVKVTKKLIKNRCKFTIKKMRKKAPKNLILEGVGLNLGRVWDALGSLVVTFGRILTLFWTFKIISCKSIGPRWAPRGLLDGFWVALERFWDGLGRVWGGIWKDLEPFEQGMDRFWICLA